MRSSTARRWLRLPFGVVTTKGYGDGPHRSGSADVTLDVATARSPDLIRAALLCLRRSHVSADARGRSYGYRKAGVVLSDLRPAGTEQTSLFAPESPPEWAAAQTRLMETVDALSRRFGKRVVVFGSVETASTPPRWGGADARRERWRSAVGDAARADEPALHDAMARTGRGTRRRGGFDLSVRALA
jgi:hypothetical protein